MFAASVIAFAAFALAAMACTATSGGGSDVASTGAGSPAGLLPEDTLDFTVFDVKAIMSEQSPERLRDDFENGWASRLEDIGILVDDLETIVEQSYSRQFIVKGTLALSDVRDELEDRNFQDDTYGEYEVWSSGDSYAYIAILESDNTLIYGEEEWVKDIIKAIGRESGLVMHADDSGAAAMLDKIGSGWVARIFDCSQTSDLRGCEIAGAAFSRGGESFEVKQTAAYMFRSENTAENEKSDIEEFYEDTDWYLAPDSLTADGAFVVIEATAYEDDIEWYW